MELIYASLLLHDAGKSITEENVKKVMDAAGAKADAAMIKALVSNLKDVNIEEAIKQMPVAVPAAPPGEAAEEKKEEKKDEKTEEKKQEDAAAGLSSLFG